MTRPPNATAGSLLGFLHAGPMSGWDLVQAAEQSIGRFWSLTRSQVYRELTRLAHDGLVEVGERGPRERRPYTLTEAGRAAFRAWLDQEPGPEQIRYPLLLTLSFGSRLPPERLAEFIQAHRAVHAERLAGYRREWDGAGPDADPYKLATLDFGIRYETAVLEWFAALPPAIRAPEPGSPDA